MHKPLPPRPKSKSSDDLEEVAALDAAESRATAALRLMNEERAAREAAEAELERLRAAEVQRQLDLVAKAASTSKIELAHDTPKSSMRPGVLTVQAKGLKVGIPLALLVPLVTGLWAGIGYFNDFQRQFKAMQVALAAKDARLDAIEQQNTAQSLEIAGLRETAAALSGYLTGVLPKAGVNVPGTGSPIQSDPLPVGARRPTPVNVRTPVPTPPPK